MSKVRSYRLAGILFLALLLPAVRQMSAQQPIRTVKNGHIESSRHDVYNDKGQLAVSILYTYDASSTVHTRTLTSYDSQGRIKRREQYTAADFMLLEDDFRYDKHGNLTRRVTTFYEETGERNSTVETRKYKYAKDGTVLYRAYYLDGKLYFEEKQEPPAAPAPAPAPENSN